MTANEFCARLFGDCALAPDSHVLAAVSGGADSVALLCLLCEAAGTYPLEISCVHVEHGIRGAASLEDAAFVCALCGEKNVPLYTVHVDAPAYAREHGCGLEDAARVLRHEALARTADRIGASAIALAHHAGDQAETVLLHAMRGSDVRGLCAMRMRRGRLIRPLLDVQPKALRDYLKAMGQSFCEDETNADTAFARNRVRHEVLPPMEQASPGAGHALCRLARAAQRDEDYFSAQLDALAVRPLALVDGLAVERAMLAGLHPALLSRLLVRLVEQAGLEPQRAGVIEAVMDALDGGEAAVNLTGGAHARIGRRYLCLTRAHVPEIDVALRVPGVTDTPFGRFEVREAAAGETGDGKTAQRMPADLLEGARVTGRRAGDTMIPFGRNTPVKLKKLMIDAGIERAMRASVPVIRRHQDVLFAVGLRPAQCCRGTRDGKQMMVRFCGKGPVADGEQMTGRTKS